MVWRQEVNKFTAYIFYEKYLLKKVIDVIYKIIWEMPQSYILSGYLRLRLYENLFPTSY